MTQWQPQQQPGQTQWGQPQYPPQGYPQPGYGPSYGGPGPQPPRRSRKGLFAFLGCGGLIALVIVIAAIGAASKPSSSTPVPPAAASTQAAAPASAAAAATAAQTPAAKPVQVAAFSGSGTENTPKFTVGANWAISYAFDCTSFGPQGNFQVFTDGGSDFSGVIVNDLAESKQGITYAYNDPGSHYLEVNSECSWSVKVWDEG